MQMSVTNLTSGVQSLFSTIAYTTSTSYAVEVPLIRNGLYNFAITVSNSLGTGQQGWPVSFEVNSFLFLFNSES